MMDGGARNFVPMFFMIDILIVFSSNFPFPITLDSLPDPLRVESFMVDDFSTIFEISEESYLQTNTVLALLFISGLKGLVKILILMIASDEVYIL